MITRKNKFFPKYGVLPNGYAMPEADGFPQVSCQHTHSLPFTDNANYVHVRTTACDVNAAIVFMKYRWRSEC